MLPFFSRQRIDQFLERIEYKTSLRILPFFIAAIVVAATSIVYSKVFFMAEEVAVATFTNNPWFVSLPITLVGVFISWFLPYKIAKQAGGSGIPQMLIANELDAVKDNKLIHSLIGLRTILTKIIASILCVLGGGAIGQEGPTLQIASGLFWRIGEKSTRWIQQLSLKPFILAGGASGLAAAFNTPLGGIAYALEELSRDYFNNFKTYVLWSVITTGLLVQTFQGGYLYLGFPEIKNLSLESYAFVIGIAAVTGIAGSFFGESLWFISRQRKRLTSTKSLAALNLSMGFIFWLSIFFIGPVGIGGGKRIIMDMLFKGNWAIPADVALRIAGPLLMAAAGAAGGLFAPSLAVGATMGSLLSQMMWPHNHHTLILTSMIAFLTGFMKTPFTAFILVFEMTDRHSSLFPMMLAAVVAASASRLFHKHSYYDQLKEEFFHDHKLSEKPAEAVPEAPIG